MDFLTTHSTELRDFVQRVQERAGLDNYEEAHALCQAALNVLGQSISGGEAKRLSEWVPPELQEQLAGNTGQASGFDKTNFLEKVAGKVHSVDLEQVEREVSAVFSVLRDSTEETELEDTIAQLPPALSAMFG